MRGGQWQVLSLLKGLGAGNVLLTPAGGPLMAESKLNGIEAVGLSMISLGSYGSGLRSGPRARCPIPHLGGGSGEQHSPGSVQESGICCRSYIPLAMEIRSREPLPRCLRACQTQTRGSQRFLPIRYRWFTTASTSRPGWLRESES